MMLYEGIADRIGKLISRGALRPGERIPSVRSTSVDQRVSVTTVLQAYALLESRGLVEARPKSGYFVSAVSRALPPEPTMIRPPKSASVVEVGDLVARVFDAARDPGIVPLGAACPSPEIYPNAKLTRMMSAIARRSPVAINSYDFPPGCGALRRQLARRSLNLGCSLSPDEIVTTSGTTESLNLCLRSVAKPGDVIAVESPTYFGILQAIQGLGMTALEICTHPREGIDLGAMEEALARTKVKALMCMPTFHNPLGAVMPEASKKQLVELLAKHDVPLIEDDLNGELYFDGKRPKPAKAFDRLGTVLYCSSFSKTLAPGYRVGWIAPGRYKREVEKLKLMTTIATATLPQLTVAAYLEGGAYDRHLRSLRRMFRANILSATGMISEFFPEGTKVTRPTGGFVLWIELPEGTDALELHRRALEENISICPGPMFSARQRHLNFIRLSCAQTWSERIRRAVARIGDLARDQRRRA